LARERRGALEIGATALGRRTRAPALALHELGEAGLVDGQALIAGELGRQLEREAVRVVQSKRVVGRDRGLARGARALDDLVEQRRTGAQGPPEALFL